MTTGPSWAWASGLSAVAAAKAQAMPRNVRFATRIGFSCCPSIKCDRFDDETGTCLLQDENHVYVLLGDAEDRWGRARVAYLEVVDGVKQFSSFRALSGVSIAVERGEFFTLLGPSGCGKTTLLRAIAGFNDLTSGRI